MRLLPLPVSVWPTVTTATVVLGVWVGWGSYRDPESWWAPGDLSRYHADIPRCTQCHEPFVGPVASKCVQCHSPAEFEQVSRPDMRDFHLERIRKAQSCRDCHWEHRGALASIRIGTGGNPHGEFIFIVTGTRSCTECHAFATAPDRPPVVLESLAVRELRAEGEGSHRPGQFASCLRCHAGGELDIEDDR